MYSLSSNQSFDNLIKETYFNHTGRFSRKQFIIAEVLLILSTFFFIPFFRLLCVFGRLQGVLIIIWLLSIIYAHSVIAIKRLHDIDLSGWFSILVYIPYLGVLFYIYLILKKGDNQKNQFDLLKV